jgi:hypothetical protein
MAGRLLIELVLFATPWVLFALYVAMTRDAVEDGRRRWPINALFLSGLALALIGWFAMVALDRGEVEYCRESSRMEDGKIVQGALVPCEHNLENAGTPRSDNPGGSGESPRDAPQ